MAKKVSPEQISEMLVLYSKLGTYSAVAKQMGISASTVSRYIKNAQNEKTYISYSGPAPSFPHVLKFEAMPEVKSSYMAFVKEFE